MKPTYEQLHGWLERIDALVDTEAIEEICAKDAIDEIEAITKEDVRAMARTLGKVYSYAHRIRCKACADRED